MAQMSVAMSLTLADTASGPLRAVTSLLEQMQTATNRLAPRLNQIATGIQAIGASATGSRGVQALATQITALNNVLGTTGARANAAAAGVRAVGTSSNTAGASMLRLERNVSNLTAALSRWTGQLTAAAAGANALGAATGTANAGMALGTRQLGQAGAAAQATNAHMGALAQTLRGMAQLWAAARIKEGLVVSGQRGMDFETAQTRSINMALTPEERRATEAAAISASRGQPQFDRLQMYEMVIDLRNAMNSVQGAIAVLPLAAQMAYNLKLATPSDKEFNPRAMLDVGKILQQRGAVTDPKRMAEEMDMLTRIYTATQGRVDMSAMLGNIQQAKGGLGDWFDLQFMPIMAAMIEQNRAGGGTGGVIGTQLTSMQRYVLGNVRHGMSAKMAAELGLIDKDKVVWNTLGNIDLKKSELRMAGAEQFQRNPFEWVQRFLLPALQRGGVDTANPDAVNMVLNRLFPNRNAAEVAGMMATKGGILQADASITNRTLGNAEQAANNLGTTQARWDALLGKVRDLSVVVGERLLPGITAVANIMVPFLDKVAAFFTAFPASATFLVWATAIGTVVLALRGFANIFGVLGQVGVLLRALGPAGATAATGMAAAATGTAAATGIFGGAMAALGLIGRALLRLIPLVGALVIAWDFAKLIGNLEIGGKAISAWVNELLAWVVGRFAATWNWISDSWIGSVARAVAGAASGIIPGAQAAGLARTAAGFVGGGPSASQVAGARQSLRESENALLEQQRDARRSTATATRGGVRSTGAIEFRDLFEQAAGPGARAGRGSVAVVPSFTPVEIQREDIRKEDELARAREEQELEERAARFREESLRAQGDKRQAELARIQRELDENGKLLVLKGKITQEELDAAKAKAVAASNFRYQQEDIDTLRDNARRQEDDLQAAVQAGDLSQFEAEQRIFAIRQQLAAQMDGMIAQARTFAAESGDYKLVRQAEDAGAENRRALGAPNPVIADINRTLRAEGGRELGNAIASVIKGVETLTGAADKFFRNMRERMIDLISQKLGDRLFDSLFGNLFRVGGASGGGSGGIGGLFGGGLGELIGSFGGATGKDQMGPPTPGTGLLGMLGSAGKWLASFDTGIDYVPRDMLAMIHEGERVVPAKFNRPGFAGTGGGAPSATLVVTEGALRRSLGDWLEGELASQQWQLGRA